MAKNMSAATINKGCVRENKITVVDSRSRGQSEDDRAKDTGVRSGRMQTAPFVIRQLVPLVCRKSLNDHGGRYRHQGLPMGRLIIGPIR